MTTFVSVTPQARRFAEVPSDEASKGTETNEGIRMSATDDPLVSTEWLAAHLNDPKVKVIDASFKLPGVLPLPFDDYLAAHIPGAPFFDVDAVSDHNDPRPHMYPNAAQFARDVAGLASQPAIR